MRGFVRRIDPDEVTDVLGYADESVREAVLRRPDEDRRERLHEQFEEAKRTGITGVPTFAYAGHAARGAIPPEQLRRLVEGT